MCWPYVEKNRRCYTVTETGGGEPGSRWRGEGRHRREHARVRPRVARSSGAEPQFVGRAAWQWPREHDPGHNPFGRLGVEKRGRRRRGAQITTRVAHNVCDRLGGCKNTVTFPLTPVQRR